MEHRSRKTELPESPPENLPASVASSEIEVPNGLADAGANGVAEGLGRWLVMFREAYLPDANQNLIPLLEHLVVANFRSQQKIVLIETRLREVEEEMRRIKVAQFDIVPPEGQDELYEKIVHLKEMLKNYRQRVYILEERKALYGVDTPPQVDIEIRNINTKMAKLERELRNTAEQIVTSGITLPKDNSPS
jgi:hypothetical protein